MKSKQIQITLLFVLIAIWLLSFSGCSTRRNTAAARGYHNLTSHYNVYWNGMNNMQEGIVFMLRNRKDNYQHILRVYNYGDQKLAKQMHSKMNRTLQKASLAIQHHSMVFNGKEQVHWVTESYLMMGRAYFYQHNYTAARRVFDFVSKKFNFLPIHYLGILWLAKTAIETQHFEKADAALNFLNSKETENNFPLDVENKLPLVQADFYLAKHNTAAAYPFLERSLRVCKDRDLKSRILFIMGQINQKDGNLKLAGNYYKQVIKRNPPFQMAFEARLNLATSYDAANGNKKYIVNTLKKMAKKNQYHDFLDQIYFALADVAEKNHQDSLEIHYLKLSVDNSKDNKFQKSTSSLKLADLLFNTGKYVTAKAYYDTAVRFLPKDFPNYDQVVMTAGVLSRMVNYLQTIYIQDSLQRLAHMDTTTLYALLDNKIKLYKKAQAEKKKEAEISAANASFSGSVKAPSGFTPGNGGWYFYNTAAKSKGYSEFLKRWGNRKLEDLWFISDKQLIENITIEANTTTTGRNTGSKNKLIPDKDPTQRAFYLKGLPKTPQDFRISDSLIIEAFNKLGFLYLEELHDTIHAQDIYSRFDKRYPDNPYRLETWYHLYKIYSGLHKDKPAQAYKQQILQNYPNSLYAKVISDPDFYKKLEQKQLEAEKLYYRTYEAYKHEQYYRALSYARRALNQFAPDTVLTPKFMFLQALAIGKTEVPDSLYNHLQRLVEKYPKNKIIPRAQAIIKMLQKEYGIGISAQEHAAMLAKSKKQKGIGDYVFDAGSPQFVMVIANNKKVQINALVIRLSDFNHNYFKQLPLKINSLALDDQSTLITIGKMNLAEAQKYYNTLQQNSYVFSGIEMKNYRILIISDKNYPVFYRDKNLDIYQQFFKKYYQQTNQNQK